MAIMASNVSVALIQVCMDRFTEGLPVNCFSSHLGTMLRVSIISVHFSLSIVHSRTHQLTDCAHDDLTEDSPQRPVTVLWLLDVRRGFLLDIENSERPQGRK